MTEDNLSLTDHKKAFGFVTVVGAPNAGKSTLINYIVGSKVSIVSPKVQTTRTRVLGIAMHSVKDIRAQIAFIDTPGIFKPDQNRPLEKAIVASAWQGLDEGDHHILLVDASDQKKMATLDDIISGLKSPCVLVFNKVDLVEKPKLLDMSLKLNEKFPFEATFMISAAKGEGVSDLLDYLAGHLSTGDFHYPEDQIATMPLRLLAAEITREKLFYKMHQELPYALTVETEKWEEFDNGSVKIFQTIFVQRQGHKGIILGKQGQAIKKIGQEAREELQDILEREVHLKLFVKVRDKWMEDPERYALWGLEIGE